MIKAWTNGPPVFCQYSHPAKLLRGQFPLLRRVVLLAQKPAHGHAELPGQLHQLFDLRQGCVRLPLVDGLPGHAHAFPQGLLGQAQLFSSLRDAFSDRHTPRLLSPLP